MQSISNVDYLEVELGEPVIFDGSDSWVNYLVYNQVNSFTGEGDIIFEQPVHTPSDSWSFANCDPSLGYGLYENFQLSDDVPIGKVSITGLPLMYSGGWTPYPPENAVFTVSFYDDPYGTTGEPSDLIPDSTFVIDDSIFETPVYVGNYAGFDAYEWTFELPNNVVVADQDGWMKIEGQILWGSATGGDGYSYQVGVGAYYYDDAMTLYEGGSGGGPHPEWNASYVYPGLTTPEGYYWVFDDEHYSMEQTIGHVYSAPGVYEGYLQILGFVNGIYYDWDSFTVEVTAPGAPLTANAGGGSLGQYEVTMGEPVELSGLATGGTKPYTYIWDLGDGRTIEGQNPSIIYKLDEENPETTTYTVTLTVIDSNYDTSTDTVTVTILAPGELSVGINMPLNTAPGYTVISESIVSGGVLPYTYFWDFGDGITSTEENPSHIYENPGVYTVTLTVTDGNGQEKTKTKVITVTGDSDTILSEIKDVLGGFGIKAIIAAGTSDCNWDIAVDGSLVLFGGEAEGTIPAETEETAKLGLSLAFGNVNIAVTAGGETEEYTAFAVGPFYLNLQEA
jgi:PKD repeat protein